MANDPRIGGNPLMKITGPGTSVDIVDYAPPREAMDEYRTLFDQLPMAVYTCDSSGVIQTFNRRAAELWGRAPAVGETDERYMPHTRCTMADIVSGTLTEVRGAEVPLERPDGSRVTVVVNIRPQKNQRGEVVGAVNCFYDIARR